MSLGNYDGYAFHYIADLAGHPGKLHPGTGSPTTPTPRPIRSLRCPGPWQWTPDLSERSTQTSPTACPGRCSRSRSSSPEWNKVAIFDLG